MNHRGTETQRGIYPQITQRTQIKFKNKKEYCFFFKAALKQCSGFSFLVFNLRNLRITYFAFLWVVSVSLCLCGSNAFAQKKPETPPVVEKITEKIYRVGKAIVDTAEKTVMCSGEINQDDGAVEYLAVAPGGKLHESLLKVDVRPLHLQVALLLLGLEPKNVLQGQGDSKTPEGDPVEIRVRWRNAAGETQEVRAESLLVSMPKNAPMPEHPWVFTGSRIIKEGFEGDIAKSLVAVWHDPAALLDNPLKTGANNVWAVNTKRTPKRGTMIEFIIKALPKPTLNEKPDKSKNEP